MDNLKSPAYPSFTYDSMNRGDGLSIAIQYTDANQFGFTKLEKAALMIAQGLCADPTLTMAMDIAKASVDIAKSVLEEANK